MLFRSGREDEGIVGVVAATGVEIVCTHAGIQGGPEAGAFEFQNAKDSGVSSEKKAAETKAWGPRVSGMEAGAARAETDARSWAASGPRARK